MFILNINMNCHDVDVNVTPDKLQMFIKNEPALLASIKASLLKMYNRSFKSMNVEDNSLNSSKNSSQLINSFFTPTVPSKKKFSQVPEDDNGEVLQQVSVDSPVGPVVQPNEQQTFPARKRSKLDDDDAEAEETRAKLVSEARETKRLRENVDIQIYEPRPVVVQAESPKRSSANQTKITACFTAAESPPKVASNKGPSSTAFTLHRFDNAVVSPSTASALPHRSAVSSINSRSPQTPRTAVVDNPLKLFQTRIGTNTRVEALNDSVSERIDLHGAGGQCLIGTSPAQKPSRHGQPEADLVVSSGT